MMKKSESLYDKIRKDWVIKFILVDVVVKKFILFMLVFELLIDEEILQMGWVLSKVYVGFIWFFCEVKEYFIVKFEIGE